MNFFSRPVIALLSLGLLAGCTTSSPEGPYSAEAGKVNAILERWIEAQGGRAVLRNLSDWETQQLVTTGPGGVQFHMHNAQTVTGLYRYEFSLPAVGLLVEAYDGRVAWRQNDVLGFGMVPVSDLIVTRRINDSQLPLKVERTYLNRRLLPEQVVAGRPCDVLEMTGPDGVPERWFFEREGGQLVRQERPGALELALRLRVAVGTKLSEDSEFAELRRLGKLEVSVVEFSDFRKVGDYTTAFVTRRTEGEHILTFHTQSMVVNRVLPPDMFSPPAVQLRNFVKVEEILQQHLHSAGGLAAFAQIHTRVMRTAIDITSAGIKSHATVSVKRPNLVLSEQDTPGIGRTVEGFDGTTAWTSSELQGYRVLQGAERQQLVNSANLQADTEYAQLYPLRKFLGEKTINDRRTYAVSLASLQGVAGVHYFDAENGRLLRAETNFAAGSKGMVKATVDFADFRTVDGVVMPFLTTVNNPAVQMTITVESVQNNVPLDDAIFQPRKED